LTVKKKHDKRIKGEGRVQYSQQNEVKKAQLNRREKKKPNKRKGQAVST